MGALIRSVTLETAYYAARDREIRHVLLAGPPGVGKTTFCFLLAQLIKYQAWKVQFHAESTPAEIYGMYVPGQEGKGFEWMPGPLDLAYSAKRGLLILDEIVEASGPCKTALYGALDDGYGGTMSYVGRTFTPSKHYKVAATMNGWPYEGGLPEALLDRFDATFIITRPGNKQLELLEPDIREMCINAYDGAADPMVGPSVTYRMLRSFQKQRKLMDVDQAVLSACHGDERLAGDFLEVLALQDPVPQGKGIGPASDEDLEEDDEFEDEEEDDEEEDDEEEDDEEEDDEEEDDEDE